MGLKKTIKKAKARIGFHTRNWRKFPCVIQVDTNNHCGLEYCGIYCTYCYPQWKIMQKQRQFMEMPMDWIKWILQQIRQDGKTMAVIDWFLNGDGLTEPRLPEILHLSKKYCPSLWTQTFTNGILTENVDFILDRNLDSICFTISAHNKELYKKVHRGDRFENVIKTLELVLDKRHSTQNVEVHGVLTHDNIPYVNDWWQFFGKYDNLKRVLSPLVSSWDNLPSKTAMGSHSLEELENLVIKVAGERGRMWTRALIPDLKPCVLWDNMSIDVEGYVLQCCNWSPPDAVNYGTVQELIDEGRTLKQVWFERLANKMRNKLCRSCNMKHEKWQSRVGLLHITYL